MWHHGKSYPQWEAIDRSVPEALYFIGRNLQSEAAAIGACTILVCVAIYLAQKLRAPQPLSHLDHGVALLSVLTAVWMIRPQVFETIPLYFMRVFNLTGVAHRGFHGPAVPVPGGYLTLAICDLPALVLVAVLISPLLLIPKIRRTLSASEQQLWIMGSVVSLVWILFLSTSSKQAWRYAMPVAPQLYILACLSLCALGRLVGAPRVPIALFLILKAVSIHTIYPKWDLYQSLLAPPSEVAFRIGAFHPRSGQVEALKFLVDEAKKMGRPIHVTVFGDGTTLVKEAARWLGEDARRVRLGYYPENQVDYILLQGNIQASDDVLSVHFKESPVHVSLARGVPVARIFKIVR
jgi:hypothetical protein